MSIIIRHNFSLTYRFFYLFFSKMCVLGCFISLLTKSSPNKLRFEVINEKLQKLHFFHNAHFFFKKIHRIEYLILIFTYLHFYCPCYLLEVVLHNKLRDIFDLRNEAMALRSVAMSAKTLVQ
jgi:hypothetical protein